MKIVFISDTHTMHDQIKLPKGDMIIHCGDALGLGTFSEFLRFIHWFNNLPYKYRIFIPGNHDRCLENINSLAMAKTLLYEDTYILCHDEIEIENIRIFGSPYTPEFCNWAFNVPRGEELAKIWSQVPNNIDILVTHGPPQGILDSIPREKNLGCKDLLNALTKIKPRIHAFGHIHDSYGKKKIKNTTFINASICTETYRPINKPIVVQFK